MDIHQYETTILEKIKGLPEEKLIEIVDYINFFKYQIEGGKKRRDEAIKRMEERRKRLGPTGIKACELVAQGREERVMTITKKR